jgi:16S rRNA (cytosine967-C5)-methyltransferase
VSRAFALAKRALEGLGGGHPGGIIRGGGAPPGKAGAKAELDRVLGGLHGPDAPRASELVYGVVRRRRTLHALIGGVARRALKGKTGELAVALELGAYALVFQEAQHRERATEDALGILTGGKKPHAHVERVLTSLREALEGDPAPQVDAELVLAGRAVPVGRGSWQRLREPVLPLEGASPARRLGLLHSYPDELAAAWIERHGASVAEEIALAGNDPPPLFIRASAHRTTPALLAARLAESGLTAEPRPDLGPHVLELTGGRSSFRDSAAWNEGLFVVQDATAQEAPLLLAPKAGERVLDLCAAPGGKATYLAELAGDAASVLATDVSPGRLRKVEETARRLGLRSVATRALDARRSGSLGGEKLDAVLVDAPCSNTGVLRRRPEARWRYSERSQRKIVALAEQILHAALGLVRPGGRLVYSVCSIEPEEGPDLVRRVAGEPVREIPRLPSPRGGDGGYAALLQR